MAFSSQVLLFPILFILLITTETKGYEGLIGDKCGVDKNCVTGQTVCNGNTCECLKGHYSSNDKRECIATTSGECFEEEDCRSLAYSRCFFWNDLDGLCTCNEGYSPSEDEKECLADANYQGACRITAQCTARVRNSLCKEGKCDCQTNYHYSATDQTCYQDVGLMGPCVNTSQCIISGSQNNVVCQDGRCSCPAGYEVFQDTCRDDANHLMVSFTSILLFLVVKIVIT